MPGNLEQYAVENNLDMSVAGAVLAHAIAQKAIKGNKDRLVDLTLEELKIDNITSLVTVADIISAINGRIDHLLAEDFIHGRDEGVLCEEEDGGEEFRSHNTPEGKRSRTLDSLHKVKKWLAVND